MGLPDLASPLGQMVLLGLIFFLIFAAYYMEQGFAADLFGTTLASDTLVALYAAFTVACFVAPGVVNRYGAKPTLLVVETMDGKVGFRGGIRVRKVGLGVGLGSGFGLGKGL